MAEKAKNEERERRKESRWVSVFAGKLRASGAPGEKAFARMIEETGTTHIVTLLNEAEIQQRRICDWCKQHNVGWTHIPLSGGRLEKEEDADHLKRLVVVRAMLELGECVLVHCSAGMHRTGVAMYTILRHCGIEPEAAISAVQKSRIATYEELILPRKKMETLRLVDLAEAHFAR